MSFAILAVFVPFLAVLLLHPLALFVWVWRGVRQNPGCATASARQAWRHARGDLREAAVITACLLAASGLLCTFGVVCRLLGWLDEPTEAGVSAAVGNR